MVAYLNRHLSLPPDVSLAVRRLEAALRAAGPPLLFGLRLWASVTLALYVAFWLELDNPFWAGTSAAIVSLPQLGASLRKGWFRMIGTLVGAVMSVVLVACFPQDRILFLGALALWCAACSFVSALLRNFASYSAMLAGYSVAIIAGDLVGARRRLAALFADLAAGISSGFNNTLTITGGALPDTQPVRREFIRRVI